MASIPPNTPYALPRADDLPSNVARWTAEPHRAVLLVHDMQRYFLNTLPSAPRAELVHNAALLRKRCAGLGVPVAYTAQPGRMTGAQRGLLKDFWGPGMRSDPADREVVPELAPAPGDWTMTKWRYSAFFNSDLLERMRAAGRDQMVICGVYAHVGILATSLEGYGNDIQVFLAADAVADFSAAFHRMTLEYVSQRCGMVLPAETVFA